MKRTIFSHFYNEEYLLPFWLKHHRNMFDHGVMVNYASTDASVDIIRELCPTWEIHDSKNDMFDAKKLQPEMQEYESAHDGWKVVLNTTEFLIANMDILDNTNADKLIFRAHIMVDSLENMWNEPDPNTPLVESRTNGIDTIDPKNAGFTRDRGCRLMHRVPNFVYGLGRHYYKETTHDMHVLWYGFSPLTEKMLERKLQIKSRIPQEDMDSGLGAEHLYTKEKMLQEAERFRSASCDLSYLIKKYR